MLYSFFLSFYFSTFCFTLKWQLYTYIWMYLDDIRLNSLIIFISLVFS